MKVLLRLLIPVFLFFPVALLAQSVRTVKGVVTDESNARLSGVSVSVKGTHKATVTDADGRFSLSVAGSDATLQFSYVGYTSKEVAPGDDKSITVTLAGKGSQMNDVVVTGYGQSTKRTITGSVSSISAEDFNVGVISSPGELLAGKVPGINITKSGDPNEQPEIGRASCRERV